MLTLNGKAIAHETSIVDYRTAPVPGRLRDRVFIAPDWDSPEVNKQIAEEMEYLCQKMSIR